MSDKLDAIPGSTGRKILDGLKDAVAGNFASVTIKGQRWVRDPAPTPNNAVEAIDLAKTFAWARNRLERFADDANAGLVHYSPRELKRKIWGAFADVDAVLAGKMPPPSTAMTKPVADLDTLGRVIDDTFEALGVTDNEAALVEIERLQAAASPSPDTVREAAQAVIDRWETPAWKDRPATATYINALRAALSSAPVAGGKQWHHKKSSHVVTEIGRGRVQASTPIVEMQNVVIYEHDGNMWVRAVTEFEDGRFEPYADPSNDRGSEAR